MKTGKRKKNNRMMKYKCRKENAEERKHLTNNRKKHQSPFLNKRESTK